MLHAQSPASPQGSDNRHALALWRTNPYVFGLLGLLSPLVLLFCVELITQQSPGNVLLWMSQSLGAVFATYLVLLAFQLLLDVLLHRLWLSTLLTGAPLLILAGASHMKECINGTPLLISDLAMAGHAGAIAGYMRPGVSLGSCTWLALGLLGLLVLALFFFARWKPHSNLRKRALAAAGSALVLIGLLWPSGAQALLHSDTPEIQSERNDRLGLLAGLYSGFLESSVQAPGEYNENTMNSLLLYTQSIAKEQAVPPVQPNVILVMSESFCDPYVMLPGVTFLDDPIPNYHALAQDWPAGDFLSNTFAGGTGNVEMEVLTGVPIGFVGEGEDLTSLKDPTSYDRIPSIVRAFRDQGYATEFIHSHTDALYNRRHNIPCIGFEKLLFVEDFPEGAADGNPYIPDTALAAKMIEEFQASEKPLFLFGLTMENHQPYYAGKFPNPPELRLSCSTLSEDAMGSVQGLIQGLHGADAGLAVLLDYLEDCGEPTIVVFWGDHLPSLYMNTNDSLYSLLGYTSSGNTKDWSPEVLKKMHTTPFLVWNNYGADLDVPETVSAATLGTQILHWAGAQRPLYYEWVDHARQDFLLNRQRLFVAGDGTPYHTPPEASMNTVTAYRNIVYDILYGEGYVAQEMTVLPSAPGDPS